MPDWQPPLFVLARGVATAGWCFCSSLYEGRSLLPIRSLASRIGEPDPTDRRGQRERFHRQPIAGIERLARDNARCALAPCCPRAATQGCLSSTPLNVLSQPSWDLWKAPLLVCIARAIERQSGPRGIPSSRPSLGGPPRRARIASSSRSSAKLRSSLAISGARRARPRRQSAASCRNIDRFFGIVLNKHEAP